MSRISNEELDIFFVYLHVYELIPIVPLFLGGPAMGVMQPGYGAPGVPPPGIPPMPPRPGY